MYHGRACRPSGWKIAGFISALCVLMVLPGVASAQSGYPDRPIKLVIPFAPGGAYDAIGRPWAEKMGTTLGTVVVENRGGAGGAVGAAAVATAAPDGHTLLLGGSAPHVVSPFTTSPQPYDPVKDFAPIALIARGAYAIVVHPEVPAKNLGELIQHAKNNPGKLSYATAGTGTGNHLAGEQLKSLASVPGIVHVPYKGAGPALADVIGGHVPIGIAALNPQIFDLHRSGKVRVLAVTGPKRLPVAPDIPTAAEAVPGMVAENFWMVFAPRGTPKAIIDRIHAASAKAIAFPDLQMAFTVGGLEPIRESDPESAGKFLQDEIARWAPLIRTLDLKN